MQVIRLHLPELWQGIRYQTASGNTGYAGYDVSLVLKVCDLVSVPGHPEHYRSDHDCRSEHKHRYHQYDNEVIRSFLFHVVLPVG